MAALTPVLLLALLALRPLVDSDLRLLLVQICLASSPVVQI